MKSYRTPKVLEKKPIVAGQDLKTIIILVACFLLFLFSIFKSFLLALIWLCIAIVYLKIQNAFPQKGQLIMFLKYKTTIQCVRINEPLNNLLKKNIFHSK